MTSGPKIHEPAGGRLAEALVAARRKGQPIAPSERPQSVTVEAAMRTQAATLSLLGAEHRGWKVALGPARAAFAAPMSEIRFDTEQPVAFFPGMRIEIEFCFHLGSDLRPDPSRPLDRDHVAAAVDAIHLGIEIVGSRFAEPNSLPFPLLLADSLANVGYLVGPKVDVCDLVTSAGRPCCVTSAGQVICDTPARHPDGDPILPLVEYAARPMDALGGLRKGQIVTTGGLCGAVPLPAPGRVVARVGPLPPLTFDVI